MSRNSPPSRQTVAEMTRQIEVFNEKVAVGDPVAYRRDDGELFHTKTRSAAYILSGHTAVIFLEEMAGAVLLSRVNPFWKEPEPGK